MWIPVIGLAEVLSPSFPWLRAQEEGRWREQTANGEFCSFISPTDDPTAVNSIPVVL